MPACKGANRRQPGDVAGRFATSVRLVNAVPVRTPRPCGLLHTPAVSRVSVVRSPLSPAPAKPPYFG